MWQKQTEPWIENDDLVVVGVVQEQHAERTRLYAQWRQLDWPLAQDALNLMNIGVVPLTIAIDESGYVRSHRALRGDFMDSWLEKPAPSSKPVPTADVAAETNLEKAQQLVLWNADSKLDHAIEMIENHLVDNPEDSVAHFRLGVALRKRFDSEGDPSDFQEAVNHWSQAIKINPRQYIYHRRIQQFGARLDKPYPFYDWVDDAISEIKARGEEPVEQLVSLTESELAGPLKGFFSSDIIHQNPDPDGKLTRDDELVSIDVVLVPKVVAPGKSARVHVILNNQPNSKWNNEADPTQLWIEGDDGVTVSDKRIVNEPPPSVESNEARRLEFEVRLPEQPSANRLTVKAFALYTVCRQDNGQCLFLRQDFEIPITVSK